MHFSFNVHGFRSLSLSISLIHSNVNVWRIWVLRFSCHCKHFTNENNRQRPFCIYLFSRDENIHIVCMCKCTNVNQKKKVPLRNLNTLYCTASDWYHTCNICKGIGAKHLGVIDSFHVFESHSLQRLQTGYCLETTMWWFKMAILVSFEMFKQNCLKMAEK